MGFKADTSFLRFLSMGAAGARQTMKQMRDAGFEPIELERYCTSNKIWSTKVKRLRLPDLLCVRTGLRVEVRAKSDLKIRMSDAPANLDRRWNSGLRDNDLSAFIACFDRNGQPIAADEAVFFSVGDLRRTEDQSKLGDPKSASEGAERDRTWPSIIPARSGVVQSVDESNIRVVMDADEERPQRNQTYSLRGKTAYVGAGERFVAEASILAGAPARRLRLVDFANNRYDPLGDVAAPDAVDRYAAVKALPYRQDKARQAMAAIEGRLEVEAEVRVLLEAAGAGTVLGSAMAREKLETFVWDHDGADLRMEAVLILTELRTASARDILLRVATDEQFKGHEIRQAAVWGLGKAGGKNYNDLLAFLSDTDSDVVLHAIAGFGADAPQSVIDVLIQELIEGERRKAPAASEALRVIGSEAVLSALTAALRASNGPADWLVATLGRLSATKVREALRGDPLLDRVAPMLLLASSSNWLAEEDVDVDLKFLLKQNF